ncbi:MAG: DUF6249 domain-containing protein [Verrucomicrobiota bacterium]|jgi:hypothetical protein
MFNPATIGVFIPIIAIVMGLSIPLVAMILTYRKRKEMFALYHQERMAAIEKGVELPPLPETFFAEDGRAFRPHSPHRHLLTGLILLLLGLALTLALYFEVQSECVWGLIPAAIGVAYLIYYFTVGKKEALAIEAAAKAKAAQSSPPTTS